MEALLPPDTLKRFEALVGLDTRILVIDRYKLFPYLFRLYPEDNPKTLSEGDRFYLPLDLLRPFAIAHISRYLESLELLNMHSEHLNKILFVYRPEICFPDFDHPNAVFFEWGKHPDTPWLIDALFVKTSRLDNIGVLIGTSLEKLEELYVLHYYIPAKDIFENPFRHLPGVDLSWFAFVPLLRTISFYNFYCQKLFERGLFVLPADELLVEKDAPCIELR